MSVALGGIVMGLGIAGMHYTGMAAMRMPAALSHDRLWLTLSILIPWPLPRPLCGSHFDRQTSRCVWPGPL